MALFSECTPQCAQKHLTLPTLSETRFFNNYESPPEGAYNPHVDKWRA
jgi:hypothetical protein